MSDETSAFPPGRHRRSFRIDSPGAIAALRLPHLVLAGARPGPVSAVTAGQHGRELAGSLVSALLFRQLDPADVLGTVHFLPVLNPLAIRTRRQDFPCEEARYRKLLHTAQFNLDRLWGGGDAMEPVLSRITSTLWQGVLGGCSAILDLHSWSEIFCSMAWAHERDSGLLSATGFPFQTLRSLEADPPLYTLRERAWSEEIPIVVVELPGQNVVRPEARELGLRVVRNFLIARGHLEGIPEIPSVPVLLRDTGARCDVEAPAAGLWSPGPSAGDFVYGGNLLGEVLSLDSLEVLAEVRAPRDGLLFFNGPPFWGEDHRESQLVMAGQPLARILEIAQ
jgi:uncharacterized protein